MEYKIEEESEFYSDTNSENIVDKNKRSKTSYVWTFFRPIEVNGKEVNECIICNAYVGKQTSNLARHLVTTHSITKPNTKGSDEKAAARLRTSRSFVWKYSTKEDLNHARCHFCDKVLYCGGGNTSNLSKHLRRRHMDVIDERMDVSNDGGEEVAQATSTIIAGDLIVEGGEVGELEDGATYKVYTVEGKHNESASSKDRKGSYVWSFCDKLSRHTIRCRLCSKVMSFHGTANVITHLQRRHNIIGPTSKEPIVEPPAPAEPKVGNDNVDNVDIVDVGNNLLRRRSVSSSSVVWKYCKRINRDVVRCTFCKKDLSYQGTSNLQRHLHRMHGIVTPGRTVKSTGVDMEGVDFEQFKFTEEFIWDYLEELENGTKAKCKMCDLIFDDKNLEVISKHLVADHALRPPQTQHTRPSRKVRPKTETISYIEYDENNSNDNSESNWINFDETSGGNNAAESVIELSTIKKDDSFFDDIIEELDEANNVPYEDEEPMDESLIMENPLSPHSTQSCAGDMSPDPKSNPLVSYQNNAKLQKLAEQRTIVETEYFKEKAAFFRMQKYLCALQAKKLRIELERLNSQTMEYTGPTYTVNVDIPGEELAILPTQ